MNAEVPSETRFNVYAAITEHIVAAIEQGAGPFVMPWHGGMARPQNALTRMDYHGINVLALWAQGQIRGFSTGWWATYRQWQQEGAQVRKGERAATVVFFKRVAEEQDEEDGKSPPRLIARASRVFNADQVIGWTPPAAHREYGATDILESVEAFVFATRAVIDDRGSCACYRIPDDMIETPHISRFTGSPTSSVTEAYYATLLHELIHWTGARHRLNREFGEGLCGERLAAEELVAELGAAFLCADLGVSNEPRPDHAAYAASWVKLLRGDKRAIFTASRLADRATAYLHELVGAQL